MMNYWSKKICLCARSSLLSWDTYTTSGPINIMKDFIFQNSRTCLSQHQNHLSPYHLYWWVFLVLNFGFKNFPGSYEYYITSLGRGGMDAKLTKNIISKAPFEWHPKLVCLGFLFWSWEKCMNFLRQDMCSKWWAALVISTKVHYS